jgi:hypothetical protein
MPCSNWRKIHNFSAGIQTKFQICAIRTQFRKKLGDIITAKILSKEERKSLAIIFVDGKVCWIPHLPVSDYSKIKEKQDGQALLLTYF